MIKLGEMIKGIWEFFILILNLDVSLKLFQLKSLKDFRKTTESKANL